MGSWWFRISEFLGEKSSGLVILNDLKALKQGPVNISATDGNIRCAGPGLFMRCVGTGGGEQPVGRKAYPADKHFYLILGSHTLMLPYFCVW